MANGWSKVPITALSHQYLPRYACEPRVFQSCVEGVAYGLGAICVLSAAWGKQVEKGRIRCPLFLQEGEHKKSTRLGVCIRTEDQFFFAPQHDIL